MNSAFIEAILKYIFVCSYKAFKNFIDSNRILKLKDKKIEMSHRWRVATNLRAPEVEAITAS